MVPVYEARLKYREDPWETGISGQAFRSRTGGYEVASRGECQGGGQLRIFCHDRFHGGKMDLP